MDFTPSTNVILISNAPMANDYKNQMDFLSTSAQAAYFMGKAFKQYNDFTYQRKDSAIRIPENYEILYNCNYVMYMNENFGNKWIYAFITEKRYINPSVTEVIIQTDAYQTWMFDFSWHKSFVAREHVPQYDADNTPEIHTVPEKLNFGENYEITHVENINLSRNNYYMIASMIDLMADPGTVDNPVVKGAEGQMLDDSPSMLSYYVIGGEYSDNVQGILKTMSDYPWITQGIVFFTWLPESAVVNMSTSGGGPAITKQASFLGFNIGKIANDSFIPGLNTEITNFWQHFPATTTSKLLMFPYSFLEMTLYTGQTVTLKPQCIQGDTGGRKNLTINYQTYVGAGTRTVYYPVNYNNGGAYNANVNQSDRFDRSLTMSTFPQYPISSDSYLLYMANNANAIEQAKSRNEENATSGGLIGALKGAATGAISGSGFSPGWGTAIGGLLGGILGGYQGNKSGRQAMEAQEAQLQDAELKPPSLISNFGGEGFNVRMGETHLKLKWKTITTEYRVILNEYWERYGYQVNRVEIPDLRSRTDFNYIETVDCFLTGNIPDDDLQTIKNMFDNGVTIWHTSDVGNYSLPNKEREVIN